MAQSPPSPASGVRPRVLTGDTPTGRLHLGHWVGSLENRVGMQDSFSCYFLLANMHAFTTRVETPLSIRADTLEIVRDWLAAGIDPERSSVVLQSEVPAIAELTWVFAMLTPFNKVMRNPTLKAELASKGVGDKHSFGFPMYTVGQIADILSFRPSEVPVGADQAPHLELCREAARRFNQVYCGVDQHTPDEAHHTAGGVFPVPSIRIGRVGRLVGCDGAQKMSKSLGNAIFLSDTPKQVQKKVNKVFTGRQSPTEPGDTSNALFEYVRAFVSDSDRVADLERRYAAGDAIGDGDIKQEVGSAINALLEPMRARRSEYEGSSGDDTVIDIIKRGTARANEIAEETLWRAKDAMGLGFFQRALELR